MNRAYQKEVDLVEDVCREHFGPPLKVEHFRNQLNTVLKNIIQQAEARGFVLGQENCGCTDENIMGHGGDEARPSYHQVKP